MASLENVLLAIVSVCTFISYFPQIVKCLRTKQAEDLSVWSWCLWVGSSLSYTLYAVLCTNTIMLIFETSLELSFCLIILICAIVFRDKKDKNVKIVTLCGSMKFHEQMIQLAPELELKNNWCVIQPTFGEHNLKNSDKTKLHELHKKQIDFSNAIYVVNLNGYIGERVKAEIEYAKKHGKEIIYHEENK